MRQFRTTLKKRMRKSEQQGERYRHDQAFRLATINAVRARRGMPLASSLDEIEVRV